MCPRKPICYAEARSLDSSATRSDCKTQREPPIVTDSCAPCGLARQGSLASPHGTPMPNLYPSLLYGYDAVDVAACIETLESRAKRSGE